MDITKLSAYEIREKLINKEVTALEIVRAHLGLMEEKKDLNAFITINEEEAIKRAEFIDKKIKNGETLGCLAGVPVAIKDNISTRGIRTTCGSKMLENYIPPFNATVVDLIEAEDGIVLGKANLDEFAIGSTTENSYFGPSKNPIDPSKVPGGSSGGTACAVGSNQVPLGLGTDTGGSVRQPSAYCGVVGMKPSFGAISRFGVVSMANTLDQVGVIGRGVKDTAILLKVLMKKDKRDMTSYEKAGEILEGIDLARPYDFKGIKIGLIKEFDGYKLDKEVEEKFEESVEMIKSLGGLVEEINMPYLKYAPACYHLLASAETSSNLARFDGIIYGHRAEAYEDLTELYTNTRSEGLGQEVKRRIVFGTYVLDKENREKYYEKALKVRRLIKEDFSKVFEKYDLILSPTSPVLPFDLGEKAENTEDQYNTDIFAVGANLAGLGGISLPVKGENPTIGIQFTANRFEDDKLIKAGLAFEGGKVDEL